MAQEAIDTRALELAKEAKSGLLSHEEICAFRYAALDAALKLLSSVIEKHAETTDSHFKTLYNRWWGMIGGVLVVMLGIIGYLFVKSYG